MTSEIYLVALKHFLNNYHIFKVLSTEVEECIPENSMFLCIATR